MTQNMNAKKFFGDTLKLGTGTAFGQVVTVASVPILARIYSPEDFGSLGIFNAFVLTIAVISGLRYEQAILLPRKHRDGYDLMILNIAITLVTSLIAGVFLWIYRFQFSQWLGDPVLPSIMWLIGIGILLFGLYNGLNYWNTRMERYSVLGSAKVANNTFAAIFQFITGVLYAAPTTLIGGFMFGKLVENGILLRTIKKRDGLHSFSTKTRMLALAKRYEKFPKFNTWSALVNTLSWQAPAFLLGGFFNLQVVGFYTLGERVVRMPMTIIGRAIAQVFFQKGTHALREQVLDQVYRQTLRMLSRIGLVPSIVLALAGEEIFTIAMGADYAKAGIYVQILSIWAFIWFVSSPLSTIIAIKERQETGLYINVLILITRVVSLIIGGLLDNPYVALILFSVTGIFTYGWLLVWTGILSGVRFKDTLMELFAVDKVWVVSILAIIGGAKYFNLADVWIVGICTILTGLYYLMIGKKVVKML
ncbi:oligosaccharide flippase family protein [candidate division KSB1 bacterium]|nr:oligosaccharide flippase family protein [candidate division KSB1 bacterium]